MPDVHEKIEALINEHLDKSDCADRVLKALTVKEAREALRPSILQRIDRIRSDQVVQASTSLPLRRGAIIRTRDTSGKVERTTTRNVEKKALDDLFKATTVAQQSAAFIPLAGKTFITEDGRTVVWHHATDDDHLSRIRLQRSHIKGAEVDINLHERARKLLKRTGAATLFEVEQQLAQAA